MFTELDAFPHRPVLKDTTLIGRRPPADMSKKSDAAATELREYGLTYPGAHIKSPWPDHKDLAVKDKTFAYLSVPGKPFSISCKLKQTSAKALELPFTTPTGYGLGKWSWVTATIVKGDIPTELFKEWLDESYRDQAPKKLDAMFEERRMWDTEPA